MKNWILYIIGTAGAYLVVSDIYQTTKTKDSKEYWQDKNFKTDSIRLEIDYTKIKMPEFKYEVPPAQVKNYYRTDSTIINNTHVSLDSSLIKVIDSLENEITAIHMNYLKLYPTSSKLIYGLFTEDTIQLDLLHITGNIGQLIYPVNFAKFEYQYIDNQFRARPLPSTKRDILSKFELYLNGGYGLTSKAPILGVYGAADISKRSGMAVYSRVTLQESPKFIVDFEYRYKLLGWQKED